MLWDNAVAGIANVVGKFVGDKDLAAKLEADLQSEFMKYEAEIISSRKDIIVAEAQSESWMARNWRPIMMLVFVFIVFNNHVLAAWLQTAGLHYVVLELPPDMWDLLKIGLGGYIAGRTVEKSVKTYKGQN